MWIFLISSCQTRTHYAAFDCPHLTDLWFCWSLGSNAWVQTQRLGKSHPDTKEEPNIQAEEVARDVLAGVLKELMDTGGG